MNTLKEFLKDCNWAYFIEENNYTVEELKEFYNSIHDNFTYEDIQEYCQETSILENEITFDKNLISIMSVYDNLEKQLFLNHVYHGNIDIMYFKEENFYGTFLNNYLTN